jgi:CubicO group peptidase (beta-lactamase class C family)
MKKTIIAFLLCISFLCSSQQKTKTLNQKEIFAAIDKNANALLKDSKAYSVSIGVVKDGKIYTRHYGEIDKGKGNKAINETLFEIASTTKVFTGILVANVPLEGKLKLDNDIPKYLNEEFQNLEFKESPIKIKNLIIHRSGILTPFPNTKEIR